MPVVVRMRCAACREEFDALRKEVKRGRRFCSVKCRQAGQAGEGNFNWRGGKPARHYVNRFRQHHPEKARAHDVVKNARRDHILVAEPCETCGVTEAETKIHAHHDDYTKPLDVRWFCGACHRAHHRAERKSA